MGNPWDYDLTAIGRRASPLLVVIGSDADPRAKASGGYGVAGNSDVHQLIPETLQFEQLNLSKPFYRPQARPDMARFDCVLNLVTDPDQHPRTLETLRKLLRGYGGRVINRPDAVLRSARDQVARRLAGIAGLRVPKTLRLRNPKAGTVERMAERAGLAFPVIARRAGTHTGDIIGLVGGPADLDSACAGRGDYILTEFVDFASPDGLYRKYRLWSFGYQTIFKHMIVSDRWNVHYVDRNRIMAERPKLIDEEKRAFSRLEGDLPEAIHLMFSEVRQRLGLDFFGMDFGIQPSGEAVLFEANATMSFQVTAADPRFRYLDDVTIPSRRAFADMLAAAQPGRP